MGILLVIDLRLIWQWNAVISSVLLVTLV